MDLTSKETIKNLLDKKPSKKLGQNFLISRRAVSKIIKGTNIKSSDTIIEIGPGIGTITKELGKKANKVIGVEKDKELIKILKKTLKEFNNVEIIKKDILDFSGHNSLKNYKVVGNLPFYASSPIIRKFLEEGSPELMTIVVQKEVAERITAEPSKMRILSVATQFYGEPEILSKISKNSFWPRPEVDGAIIKIENILPQDHFRRKPEFNKNFFKIVKAGFSHPRKQLINNLSSKLDLKKSKAEQWLKKNGVDPKRRAETLTIAEWEKLTLSFPI